MKQCNELGNDMIYVYDFIKQDRLLSSELTYI